MNELEPARSTSLLELKGLLPEELERAAESLGLEPYRGRQLALWIYGRGATGFDLMTNFTKAARARLSEQATIYSLRPVGLQTSPGGMAAKYLFELPDGRRVETVLMREGRRRTVCVSSQVGCPLDCTFCATGKMGMVRDLAAAEIVDQVLSVRRDLVREGEDLTNVVMMGMGEPLLNFDAVTRAVRLMNLDYGPAISNRRITLSTAGHVPGILRLSREGPRIGLAVSLNATEDDFRNQIMPINRKWPIAELLSAVRAYQQYHRRFVTFEYVLLHGLNDTVSHARDLVRLVSDIPCKLNVIPWNPIEGEAFARPPEAVISAFVETIAAKQMTATVRYSKGTEITAGCGQLATSGAERSQVMTISPDFQVT
jgi:23S rRNA (adenine2503-C2)-methyltransferase